MGKANTDVKNWRKRSSYAVFLDFFSPGSVLSNFIWPLDVVSSNIFLLIYDLWANLKFLCISNLNDICKTFMYCSLK